MVGISSRIEYPTVGFLSVVSLSLYTAKKLKIPLFEQLCKTELACLSHRHVKGSLSRRIMSLFDMKHHNKNTLHWDEMADGSCGLGLNCRWPYHPGLNCRVSHFRLMTSPGLKLPTQSQMADKNIFKFDILKFMIS